ncbi:MAG: M20 family metallopeptidase [Oscillospiraceae bacterium]|nr:M20 family metallopeptidase [Oscillospiraceae bacterium]
MNWGKEIEEYLSQRKEDIIHKLCEFVQIPSIAAEDQTAYPYGLSCAQALDFCEALCKEHGLFTTNYAYKCVEARLNESTGGRRLVLASHADVVPPDAENLYPPFGGTVQGDYIVGRGVVDDKGPLIATLYALAFFKEKQIPLKNDIRLVFGSNEENGMDDMRYYLEKAGQPDWGLAVDDDFPVTNGEKGLIQFTLSGRVHPSIQSVHSEGERQRLIHDRCTVCHSEGVVTEGRLAPSDNPMVRTVEQYKPLLAEEDAGAALEGLCRDTHAALLGLDRQDEASGRTLLRPYQLNTQGGNLVCSFDLRLPVSFPVEEAVPILRAASERLGFALEITKLSPGYYVPESDPMVSLLTNLYNSETGSSDKPYVMGACTYARLFRHGCGFGAGNPHEVKPFPSGHGAAHGPDEAHNIQVLLTAIKMYILGIQAIDAFWS